MDRNAARVKATRKRIELKLKCVRLEKMAIEAKIINASTNYGLLKELHKVDDQMAKADIKLKDEIKMKLTIDEKMTHNNVCLT